MTTVTTRRPSRASLGADPLAADGDQRRLEWAAWFFTLAVLVHNADHVRRNAGTLAHDVFAVGTAAMAVEVAIVVMVFGRHRLAPLFAAVAGASLAAGYVLVHFTP